MLKKESIKKEKIFYYKILPAYNVDEDLIYSSETRLPYGSIIRVNIRGKEVYGCTLENISEPKNISFSIKPIIELKIKNKITENIIKFIDWFSMYNLVSRGYTLKQFLPNDKIINPRKETFLKVNKKKIQESLQDNKLHTLNNLLEKKPRTFQQLLKLNFTKYYLNKILKEEKIIEEKKDVLYNFYNFKKKIKLKKLNKHQIKSYHYIKSKLQGKKSRPIFLDGITGSGKTEVYFRLIKDYLLINKQILVLLPEIGLAEQWVNRFKEVFGFPPLQWNSSILNKEKNKIWQSAIKGQPIVVVGTRSSIFLPFSNLAITIVDEENDISYKQEEKIIYNARDMAIVRAKISDSFVVLVSATPSLETYKNYITKKFYYTTIKKRFGKSVLPDIHLIDMKKEKGKIFSEKTKNEIIKNLSLGKQSLILINRRGYAPISICIKCGAKQKCNKCDVNLVLHKKSQLLICHHCGYTKNNIQECSSCGEKESILHVGLGIEKVVEEAKNIFKCSSIISLSSDSFNNKTFKKTLNNIENNKIKLLVGTQIISKGFNFLNLNKVFILDFDMWFYNSDIRTSEKIFQLTQQVAGRAGRAEEKGEVFIQTYDIKNKLLDKIKNNRRDNFYEEELLFRKQTFLPPFSKLASIILSGKNIKELESSAMSLKNMLSVHNDFILFGPIPAPISFLKGEFRYRILIKASNPLIIQKKIKGKDIRGKISSKISFKIDIDPYSFF